jgi:regulator of cell morphogenesis and NO signaling
MEPRFYGEERVGDIVADFPGASNLFKEVAIDFCCGGDRTLSDAIRQKNLDKEEILRRLNESYDQMRDRDARMQNNWREAPVPELIDHIVHVHHAYLRKELPLLSEFTTKILRVHGGSHPELTKLHTRFHQLKMELEQHLIAEEEQLFPLLKQLAQNPSAEQSESVKHHIRDLEDDHSAAGDCLKEMRAITNEYTLPPNACRTFTLTYQKLQDLESDLFQHIHLENNVLFPRVEEIRV